MPLLNTSNLNSIPQTLTLEDLVPTTPEQAHLLSRSLAAAAPPPPPPPLLTALLLYLAFHVFSAETKLVDNAVGTLINYGSLLEEGPGEC